LYWQLPDKSPMAGSRFGFRTLFADALARAQSAVDSLWRSPPHPPRLVHGDLTPANVIASPPSGLVPIDFQDTTWPVMPSEFAPGCGARSACIPDGTDAGFRRVRERQVASLARAGSAHAWLAHQALRGHANRGKLGRWSAGASVTRTQAGMITCRQRLLRACQKGLRR